MNTEAPKILLLLVTGLGVAALLNRVIVSWQRRIALHRTRALEANQSSEPERTFAALIVEWTGRGLRMLVWVLFLIFAIYLVPQTRAQFDTVGERLMGARDNLLDWLFSRGIMVVVIVVATLFLARFVGAVIRAGFEIAKTRTSKRDDAAAQRRLKTLSSIFRRTAQGVILFIGLLELLPQLDLNVTPILASAGVVGLAVGFGAQNLIKDLFSGLLILLEDQYNVGDTIRVGETTGKVERLSLRATQVRNLDGAMTIIPNGAIVTVANLSKGWSRVVLDMEIDYQEDMDRAMELMLEEARAIRVEQPHEVIDDPVMLGVDRMTNSSIVLRMLVKTAPARQQDIGRELRRRIKLAFDRNGVRVAAVPRQVMLVNPEMKNN